MQLTSHTPKNPPKRLRLALGAGLLACLAAPTFAEPNPPTSCDGFLSRDAWTASFTYESTMQVSATYWRTPHHTANPFLLGATTAHFDSRVLETSVNYVLWLPPSYSTQPAQRYPVVYFLPGAAGHPWQVGAFLQHLRSAIDQGLAPEMIVVGVNAIATPAFYIDAVGGELPLESVIVQELLPHIDATYRTRPQAGARAVEGYSLGGYGALHLALKYPHIFGAATSLAGYALTPPMTEHAAPGTSAHGIWCHWLDASPKHAQTTSIFTQLERAHEDTLARISIRLGYGASDPNSFIQRSAERMQDILERRGHPPAAFIEARGVWHSDIEMYDWLGPQGFTFYRELFARD